MHTSVYGLGVNCSVLSGGRFEKTLKMKEREDRSLLQGISKLKKYICEKQSWWCLNCELKPIALMKKNTEQSLTLFAYSQVSTESYNVYDKLPSDLHI